jgi:hypothetical protein
MHGAKVQNHFSYNNQAQGLWFDTDNKDIVIDNATLVGSANAALQIERTIEGILLLADEQPRQQESDDRESRSPIHGRLCPGDSESFRKYSTTSRRSASVSL